MNKPLLILGIVIIWLMSIVGTFWIVVQVSYPAGVDACYQQQIYCEREFNTSVYLWTEGNQMVIGCGIEKFLNMTTN